MSFRDDHDAARARVQALQDAVAAERMKLAGHERALETERAERQRLERLAEQQIDARRAEERAADERARAELREKHRRAIREVRDVPVPPLPSGWWRDLVDTARFVLWFVFVLLVLFLILYVPKALVEGRW